MSEEDDVPGRSSRISLGVWILIVVLSIPIAWLAWEDYHGRQLVRALCARDGGERILETVNVTGYVTDPDTGPCAACTDYLLRGEFQYIDREAPSEDRYYGIPEPGLYRFTISKLGDPRCAGSESSREFMSTKIGSGYSPSQCLAVERLNGPPRGFAYRQKSGTVSMRPNIRFQEEKVIRLRDQKEIAMRRQYVFTPLRSDMVAFASGQGNPTAFCISPRVYEAGSVLAPKVLHDDKKPIIPAPIE